MKAGRKSELNVKSRNERHMAHHLLPQVHQLVKIRKSIDGWWSKFMLFKRALIDNNFGRVESLNQWYSLVLALSATGAFYVLCLRF